MRIMILDSQAVAAGKFADALRAQGHEVEVPRSPKESLMNAATFDPQLIISEYDLGGMCGPDLCGMIRDICPSAHVIALAEEDDTEALSNFKPVNPLMLFYKPVNIEDFLEYLHGIEPGIADRKTRTRRGLKVEKYRQPLAENAQLPQQKARFGWIDKFSRR